jgi:ferredoxin like protein
MIVDKLFELVSYRVHPEPHIVVNPDLCQSCIHRACTFACPAHCYQWNPEKERIDFVYDACLECGTCLIICDKGALAWHYPKDGFGVHFRLT